MPDFSSAAMLPLTAGLTLLGLVISFLVARKRGSAAAVRPVAWSLLPIGLYLSGLLKFAWTILDQTISWFANLLFSPAVWAGFIVLGLAVLLWVIGGATAMRARTDAAKAKRGSRDEQVTDQSGHPGGLHDELAELGIGTKQKLPNQQGSPAKQPEQSKQSKQAKQAQPNAGGSTESGEFDEIEAILKKHGIS